MHGLVVALVYAWICLFVLVPAGSGQESQVTFQGQDGFVLSGTLWRGDAQAPGILLLHQCDRDRSMYQQLGGKLHAAGFKVLTFDFRQAAASFLPDAEAAYQYLEQQYLEQQGGTAGGVIGALGASCAGDHLVSLALSHPELERVAFLSCPLSAEAERDAMQLGSRSTLFITGVDDRAAALRAGTLAYRLRAPASELMLFDGDAHGHALLEQEPGLEDSIVAWFLRDRR